MTTLFPLWKIYYLENFYCQDWKLKPKNTSEIGTRRSTINKIHWINPFDQLGYWTYVPSFSCHFICLMYIYTYSVARLYCTAFGAIFWTRYIYTDEISAISIAFIFERCLILDWRNINTIYTICIMEICYINWRLIHMNCKCKNVPLSA